MEFCVSFLDAGDLSSSFFRSLANIMFTHHDILTVRPLALDSIPLPRLPVNPRIGCGYRAGGETETQYRALTA